MKLHSTKKEKNRKKYFEPDDILIDPVTLK